MTVPKSRNAQGGDRKEIKALRAQPVFHFVWWGLPTTERTLLEEIPKLFATVDTGDHVDIQVVAENPENHSQDVPTSAWVLPGHIFRCPLQGVEDVLGVKTAHEDDPNRRKPGNVSHKPPEFLNRGSCVFVLGSIGFLSHCAGLYFERRGDLWKITFDLMLAISKLDAPYGGKGRKRKSRKTLDEHDHVRVEAPEGLYPGNFDALVERIQGEVALRAVFVLSEQEH